MKTTKLIVATLLIIATQQANAQLLKPVAWSYGAKKTSATEAVLFIRATIEAGWHLYSQNIPEGGPVKTTFSFTPSKTFALSGKTQEPKPITKHESAFGMEVSYFEKTVIFQQKVKLKKGKATVTGSVEYMTCNDEKCLPPATQSFSIPIN